MSVVARELGVSEQTPRNWVKAEQAGKLNGAGAKAGRAESGVQPGHHVHLDRRRMAVSGGRTGLVQSGGRGGGPSWHA
jgi:transposase-like protein